MEKFKFSIQREDLILILFFIVLLFLDHSFKMWIYQVRPGYPLSIFGHRVLAMQLIPDYGVNLVSVDYQITRVFLHSFSFGIFSILYTSFCFFFLRRSGNFWLRFFLTLAAVGVTSNTWDYFSYGFFIKYFQLMIIPSKTIAFNFSGVYIFVGLFLALRYFIGNRKVLWLYNNQRKVLRIINPRFQYGLGFIFVMVVSLATIFNTLFFYSLMSDVIPRSVFKTKVLSILAYGMVPIVLTLGSLCFIFGLFLAHRISGPIYALEKYIDDLKEGQNRKFRLRENDYHREIERIAAKIRTVIKKS
ncbi:MAG: hypothetical protein HOE90_13690 [Bacteriovoracaceae bacterium]|jgi:lipoprotein signal peptidase|nr:hypothetical protein [Bacteriovoracaceae bacterium]